MKKPDLVRIKNALQNIYAKKIALTREIENVRSYYKYQTSDADMASESLIVAFKNDDTKDLIGYIDELIELEEE